MWILIRFLVLEHGVNNAQDFMSYSDNTSPATPSNDQTGIFPFKLAIIGHSGSMGYFAQEPL
jgi:hypothetical protein